MNSYYSNIYWHFTGSPKDIDWSKIFCPKDILRNGSPKTEEEAINILGQILDSKSLLAKSKEKIDDHIVTDSFCCVTDIPIQNLEDQTKYYGKVAIGFKQNKIHAEFNPVFYVSKDKLRKRVKNTSERLKSNINKGIYKGLFGGQISDNINFLTIFEPLKVDEKELGSYIYQHFKLTVFSDDPSDTFYREREWRKIGNFYFELSDIASIIVPQNYLDNVQAKLDQHQINNIPILTWELLQKI